jgi:hypothetical protein
MAPEQTLVAEVVVSQLRQSYAAVVARQPAAVVAEASESLVVEAAVVAMLAARCPKYLQQWNP